MELITEVIETADKFMNMPVPTRSHVILKQDGLQKTADAMKTDGKTDFYEKEPQEFSDEDERKVIIRELVASSINYCYWYGNGDIRPGKASSTSMYNLVDHAFQFSDDGDFDDCIDELIELLNLHRFPMLEERKRHLLELSENDKGLAFANFVMDNKEDSFKNLKSNGDKVLEEIVRNFSGFASDIFLKRASLFMIQIYRQLGWFDIYMKRLFVPSDYQLPKMLEHFNCIQFSNTSKWKIQEGKLIEKGSLMECQIRAATIMACEELKKLTGWNIADIDTWLWTKRKEPTGNIHLTVTSDY